MSPQPTNDTPAATPSGVSARGATRRTLAWCDPETGERLQVELKGSELYVRRLVEAGFIPVEAQSGPSLSPALRSRTPLGAEPSGLQPSGELVGTGGMADAPHGTPARSATHLGSSPGANTPPDLGGGAAA